MDERRSPHRTQWAAQFAVASELCKLGHQVALTLGNHPLVDLMAISRKGKPFLVDVKGLYMKNFWWVRRRPPQDDLYYVFAFVPDHKTNQFYVLTQSQVNNEISREMDAARARALANGKDGDKAAKNNEGVSWGFVQSFEDAWHLLPD